MSRALEGRAQDFIQQESVGIINIGNVGAFVFNRFRNGIGWLFIAITMVAGSFLVAEFIRKFNLDPIFGIEVYYITLGAVLIISAKLAKWAEDAKISTIKGAVFSKGSNRSWQAGAALTVIIVLIIVNAYGVQAIADFSLRYMDKELQDDVIFKIKKEKMSTYSEMVKTAPTNIQSSNIKNIMQRRAGILKSKDAEIATLKSEFNRKYAQYVSHPTTYRTFLKNKRGYLNRDISKIEKKYEKRLGAIDWKISKEDEKIAKRNDKAQERKLKSLEGMNKSADELTNYYKTESGKNKELIEAYKGIGLKVAISGEVIDGVLAFMLFMMLKSNPNINQKPSVQENTTQGVRLPDQEKTLLEINNEDLNRGNLNFYKKEYL